MFSSFIFYDDGLAIGVVSFASKGSTASGNKLDALLQRSSRFFCSRHRSAWRLAQLRFEKLQGHLAALFPTFCQFASVDKNEDAKTQHANQRTQPNDEQRIGNDLARDRGNCARVFRHEKHGVAKAGESQQGGQHQPLESAPHTAFLPFHLRNPLLQLVPIAAVVIEKTVAQEICFALVVAHKVRHCDSSSLTEDIAGTRSHTTFTETRIGTESSAPGMPHSHVQNINEAKITTGFRVKRRPMRCGVTKFDSIKWSTRYQAGGRRACNQVSKVSRPTAPSRTIPARGPK